MKICIGGDIGSGKSTVAKLIAKKLNYKYYAGSIIYRKYVEENNMTMLEVCKYPKIISQLDKETDSFLISLNNKDNIVVDFRLGYHFLKNSINIYLKVDTKISTNRIFNSNRSSEHYKTKEDLKKEIIDRKKEETTRFLKIYGTNPHDPSNFNKIINTNNKTIDEIVNTIIDYLSKHN